MAVKEHCKGEIRRCERQVAVNVEIVEDKRACTSLQICLVPAHQRRKSTDLSPSQATSAQKIRKLSRAYHAAYNTHRALNRAYHSRKQPTEARFKSKRPFCRNLIDANPGKYVGLQQSIRQRTAACARARVAVRLCVI
eukprot:6192100-Pleurochrysis_carterae.AAC.1